MKQFQIFIVTLILFCPLAFAFNDSLLPRLNQGEPCEKAGDIIAPITNEEVAAWCDFTKTIILTNRSFLCVCTGKNTQ